MLSYKALGTNIYLAKEDTDRVNTLNSLLIEDGSKARAILIDANYPFRFIDALYTHIKAPALGLYCSHGHTDHTAHAFYHLEKYGTPVYCPIQEAEHLKSLNSLMKDVGFTKLGLEKTFKMMVLEYMKFGICKQVHTYTPGVNHMGFETVKIETIHIPGHSPGHTAFKLISNDDKNRKILYVSDIGSHPYYGDLNCDLPQYRDSINKLEKVYLSEDYILIPAHGTVYFEKDEDFFNRIRKRINLNGSKILNALSKTTPKSVKDLVLEWILTPKNKANPLIKDLYFLWDGGMIYQHFMEFIAEGKAQKVEEKDFLNDKYILL